MTTISRSCADWGWTPDQELIRKARAAGIPEEEIQKAIENTRQGHVYDVPGGSGAALSTCQRIFQYAIKGLLQYREYASQYKCSVEDIRKANAKLSGHDWMDNLFSPTEPEIFDRARSYYASNMYLVTLLDDLRHIDGYSYVLVRMFMPEYLPRWAQLPKPVIQDVDKVQKLDSILVSTIGTVAIVRDGAAIKPKDPSLIKILNHKNLQALYDLGLNGVRDKAIVAQIKLLYGDKASEVWDKIRKGCELTNRHELPFFTAAYLYQGQIPYLRSFPAVLDWLDRQVEAAKPVPTTGEVSGKEGGPTPPPPAPGGVPQLVGATQLTGTTPGGIKVPWGALLLIAGAGALLWFYRRRR